MKLLESMWIAVRTYSILPVPNFEWNQKNMRTSLSFLPVVGAVLGVLLYLWRMLGAAVPLDGIFCAAVCTALPPFLTGGIHMDGFMDTADAIGSHKSREEKLAIMKDPHCGAAAVLWCALYLLIDFALLDSVFFTAAFPAVCGIFVMSRSLTVITAVTIPKARSSGFLVSFTENAQKTRTLIFAILPAALAGLWMILTDLKAGIFGIVFGVLAFLLYRRSMLRLFGGVTGDTSGFFIQISELVMLLGIWLGGLL